MGWGSGSEIFREIILAAQEAIPDNAIRKAFYAKVIRAFCQNDWDTEAECLELDPVYDELYFEVDEKVF